MSVIIGVDPSGNYGEDGMGTTGVATLLGGQPHVLTSVSSKDYTDQMNYWSGVIDMIAYFARLQNVTIVCESYKLHHFKGRSASMQSGSDMPTSQLIGVIRYEAWRRGWDLIFQQPSDIKTRWSEDILVHKGYLEKRGNKFYFDNRTTNPHQRDALKHAVHYYNKKEADKK